MSFKHLRIWVKRCNFVFVGFARYCRHNIEWLNKLWCSAKNIYNSDDSCSNYRWKCRKEFLKTMQLTCWLDTWTPGSRQVSVLQGSPRKMSYQPVQWFLASSQTQVSVTDIPQHCSVASNTFYSMYIWCNLPNSFPNIITNYRWLLKRHSP